MPVIKLYKKIGETPLECLGRFRLENPNYKEIPMTYAGRLDPMAEGLLLALSGKDVKNKEQYLNLDKEYEFEVLFGFQTDTGDILGKMLRSKKVRLPNIKIPLDKFVGKFHQTYPAYSSKTVGGKQLWQIARKGELNKVEMPKKEVEIYKLKLIGQRRVSKAKIAKEILRRINLVKGDFRQDEIKKSWQSNLSKLSTTNYHLLAFRVSCSSGTYVRSLAERIGDELGLPALAFSIKRTKIGKYK